MDSKRIKILLDNYYQGKTSLEEEEILKEYFKQDLQMNGDIEDKQIFDYFSSEKSKIPINFNEELNNVFENESHKNKKSIQKIIIWAGSIAAVLMLSTLFTIFSKNEDKKNENQLYADTYKDSEEAYKEAQKVLLFISNTMNGESTGLKHLSEIDKSLKHCNELLIIDKTINSVKK